MLAVAEIQPCLFGCPPRDPFPLKDRIMAMLKQHMFSLCLKGAERLSNDSCPWGQTLERGRGFVNRVSAVNTHRTPNSLGNGGYSPKSNLPGRHKY